MILGAVYKWETAKAKGHITRDKFHVFICEGDWEEGHTFLFISSDDFGGDYRLTNPPYEFLTKPESFVSCSSIVSYSEDELKLMGKPVGQLSKQHLIELHKAIANSDTMVGRHQKRCCNALMAAFK